MATDTEKDASLFDSQLRLEREQLPIIERL